MSIVRQTIVDGLGGDLVLRILQQRTDAVLYVGMWGTWWLNGESTAMKVILATVPILEENEKPANPTTLADVAWIILQLQTVERNKATDLYGKLEALFVNELADKPSAAATGDKKPQTTAAALHPVSTSSENYRMRAIAKPADLAAIILHRNDNAAAASAGAMPQKTLERTLVPYSVFLPEDEEAQPVDVFIEKALPKGAAQRQLNQETGMSPEGTLLQAIGEWRTWVILNDQI